MKFVHAHNNNIELIDHALKKFAPQYKIRHIIYMELLDNKDQAHILSNVPGICEKLHSLGKFSNDFYSSIQKAETNFSRNFLWPANPRDEVGLSLKEYGLSNGFTIIQKHSDSIKTWAYLGDKFDARLSDLFINENHIFHDFIPHFQKEVISNLNIDIDSYMPFKCNNATLTNISRNTASHRTTRHYLTGTFSDIYITDKEQICMSLLASGKTYKEIAHNMSISSNTVKKHIDAVKLKLGTSRKSAIIDILFKTGVLS